MQKKYYDKTEGRETFLYTITDGNIVAEICDMGARLHSLLVGGVDVVLGFNSVKDYIASATFAGATVGRVANRIAGGKFTLNGKSYLLNKNNGANHLHGGDIGFDRKVFELIAHTENSVAFRYVSADGEEGYPAELQLTVCYTVENCGLKITFKGESDGDTLWCPTNHAYFNLDGEGSGDCRGNLLYVNSDYYTPTDAGLIPTGEKRAVKGTPFDFNSKHKIGEYFGAEELKATNGYDHNFILKGGLAASAESERTGIRMDLLTDMPCLQLYTGGAMGRCAGKSAVYDRWYGFCLEPQYCPNAINAEGFDKPVLRAGKEVEHYIILEFN